MNVVFPRIRLDARAVLVFGVFDSWKICLYAPRKWSFDNARQNFIDVSTQWNDTSYTASYLAHELTSCPTMLHKFLCRQNIMHDGFFRFDGRRVTPPIATCHSTWRKRSSAHSTCWTPHTGSGKTLYLRHKDKNAQYRSTLYIQY